MKRKREAEHPESVSPDITTTVVADGNASGGYPDAMTPRLIKAIAELRAYEAAEDDEKKKARPAGPGPTKRPRVAEPSGSPATPPLTRVPSILMAQEHTLPAMAVVKLRPSIELENDRIGQVVISAGHRTPSPYGARMGDHTVAWVVIVDMLRAELFGLRLEEAVRTLRIQHYKVSGWMRNRDSAVKKLLLMLRHPEPEENTRERMDRVRRLEDATSRVDRHLAAASALLAAPVRPPDGMNTDVGGEVSPQDKAREQLELAIGQHLAYVNYLPFATVRSTKARGSVGSTEGYYRRIVMQVEAPGVPDAEDAESDDAPEVTEAAEEVLTESAGEPLPAVSAKEDADNAVMAPVVPVNAKVVREALWKLFSFEAALRAADAGLALRPPGTGTKVSDLQKGLIERGKQAETQLTLYIPGKGKPRTTPDIAAVTKLRDRAEADVRLLTKRPDAAGTPTDDPLYVIAGLTRGMANWILEKMPKRVNDRNKMISDLYDQFAVASAATTDMVEQEMSVIDDAASILAYLIHDHQSSVAAAYPIAVGDSFFLSPESPPASGIGSVPEADPAAAAVQRLRSEIERSPKITLTPPAVPGEKSQLDKLLAAFATAYEALKHPPAVGKSNGWAEHRKNRHLVVSHEPAKRGIEPTITVNGRAAAPRGVAGMGSHTTAWVVEVAAADALASVPDGVLTNFATAVEADLDSEVMKLDVYLPVAQLVGGQLEQLFDAAVRVRRATTEGEAATAYLCFRNLLPFATVDAGSRGGHAEKLTAFVETLFDRGSLDEAAQLQAEALTEFDTREEAVKALSATRTALLAASKPAWAKDTVVEPAVRACAARLKAHSEALTAGAPPAELSQIILATRWLSHKSTYADAATSLMVLNAFKNAGKEPPGADHLAWLKDPELPYDPLGLI